MIETMKIDSPKQETTESIHEEDDNEDIKEMISQIPTDNEELIKFTDNINMRDFPTEFLMVLSERLKNRRINFYKTYDNNADVDI